MFAYFKEYRSQNFDGDGEVESYKGFVSKGDE